MAINVYQIVTDRIIAELEKGCIPWVKPWTGVRTGAYSRATGKPYSLLNQMLLQKPGEYVTFKQAIEAGGSVRKGADRCLLEAPRSCRKGQGRQARQKDDPSAEILQRFPH